MMVSLKSFKLINEPESDALSDVQPQSQVQTNLKANYQQHQQQQQRRRQQPGQDHEIISNNEATRHYEVVVFPKSIEALVDQPTKHGNDYEKNNNKQENLNKHNQRQHHSFMSPQNQLRLLNMDQTDPTSRTAPIDNQTKQRPSNDTVLVSQQIKTETGGTMVVDKIDDINKSEAKSSCSVQKGRAIVAVTMNNNNDSSNNNNHHHLHQDACKNDNEQLRQTAMSVSPSAASSSSSSSISIVVVRHDSIKDQNGQKQTAASAKSQIIINNNNNNEINTRESDQSQCLSDDNKSADESNSQHCSSSSSASLQSTSERIISGYDSGGASRTLNNSAPSEDYCNENNANGIYRDNLIVYSRNNTIQKYSKHSNPLHDMSDESRLSVNTESEHFEIVWSKLSYRIEPKWHKRFNYIDQVLTYFMPGTTVDSHSSATSTASSSAGMNDNQHQMHASANADSHFAPVVKQRGPTDPIEIFSNLNGTIKSGQMTAVLGPSGAGKTTLLNCLTGKLRKGVSGHINLKGANGKHLKMCTIPQKDHLLEQLTVEENLWFASKIKNPEYGFDHVKNIERVIDLLGLKRCRSAKIKKISGGQHKRVSIAQELLSNPDILVLDEPTSGLDSLTCYKTISMLRDLVELSANNDFMKPMAIIVTIHQPQPKVFNLFHHVYILANGGRVIYEGSPGRSVATITEVTGLQPNDGVKSSNANAIDPASFLIEIASEEYGLEVINKLSDHQRDVFEQIMGEQAGAHYRTGGPCMNHDCNLDTEGGAKINCGFDPEFEHSPNNNNNNNNDISVVVMDGTPTNVDEPEDSQAKIRQRSSNSSSSSSCKKRTSKKERKKKSSTTNEPGNCPKHDESSHNENNEPTNPHDPNLYLSEQLLYTRVPNHKGRFWSHTATLTHRTLLTIRRDPLLMTSRVLFHLMIPILMGHVYGKATGAANACPHYEPEIDITQIPQLVESKRIEFMLEELHMSIENVSMFFIIMYAFAAAVLALNALSFPLNMQVLLKETRNGWYSMSSYVLAKTLADLPLELTMPCMTMLLVYPLTGQPSSYLQWRMFTICLIMTLCSLIAQTQALILGALVMNSVQTAVFVSQASQLPWVILAGFTIRIKRLSEPLKLISLTSFYRLGCEAITLTRYGFGICPCDPQEITGEPVRLVGIPDQLRTVAQYWIDSVEASKASLNETTESIEDGSTTTLSSLMTTIAPTTNSPQPSSSPKTDIFQHLANQLSYANSYGVNITSCDDIAPDRIRAINLGDNWLVARIWHLIIMLIIMKILLYYAVRFSIGIRL